MTYPAIQRKAKSNKSKVQQLPKHMTTYFATKRRGKTKKRSNKGSKNTKKKKKSKTASKNIKKLTKATKEIPAPSNTPQRKSSWPRKKSRVV